MIEVEIKEASEAEEKVEKYPYVGCRNDLIAMFISRDKAIVLATNQTDWSANDWDVGDRADVNEATFIPLPEITIKSKV